VMSEAPDALQAALREAVGPESATAAS